MACLPRPPKEADGGLPRGIGDDYLKRLAAAAKGQASCMQAFCRLQSHWPEVVVRQELRLFISRHGGVSPLVPRPSTTPLQETDDMAELTRSAGLALTQMTSLSWLPVLPAMPPVPWESALVRHTAGNGGGNMARHYSSKSLLRQASDSPLQR